MHFGLVARLGEPPGRAAVGTGSQLDSEQQRRGCLIRARPICSRRAKPGHPLTPSTVSRSWAPKFDSTSKPTACPPVVNRHGTSLDAVPMPLTHPQLAHLLTQGTLLGLQTDLRVWHAVHFQGLVRGSWRPTSPLTVAVPIMTPRGRTKRHAHCRLRSLATVADPTQEPVGLSSGLAPLADRARTSGRRFGMADIVDGGLANLRAQHVAR